MRNRDDFLQASLFACVLLLGGCLFTPKAASDPVKNSEIKKSVVSFTLNPSSEPQGIFKDVTFVGRVGRDGKEGFAAVYRYTYNEKAVYGYTYIVKQLKNFFKEKTGLEIVDSTCQSVIDIPAGVRGGDHVYGAYCAASDGKNYLVCKSTMQSKASFKIAGEGDGDLQPVAIYTYNFCRNWQVINNE